MLFVQVVLKCKARVVILFLRRSSTNKQTKNRLTEHKMQVLKGATKTNLTINANSASCFLMNQSEAPEDFRRYFGIQQQGCLIISSNIW